MKTYKVIRHYTLDDEEEIEIIEFNEQDLTVTELKYKMNQLSIIENLLSIEVVVYYNNYYNEIMTNNLLNEIKNLK